MSDYHLLKKNYDPWSLLAIYRQYFIPTEHN